MIIPIMQSLIFVRQWLNRVTCFHKLISFQPVVLVTVKVISLPECVMDFEERKVNKQMLLFAEPNFGGGVTMASKLSRQCGRGFEPPDWKHDSLHHILTLQIKVVTADIVRIFAAPRKLHGEGQENNGTSDRGFWGRCSIKWLLLKKK